MIPIVLRQKTIGYLGAKSLLNLQQINAECSGV